MRKLYLGLLMSILLINPASADNLPTTLDCAAPTDAKSFTLEDIEFDCDKVPFINGDDDDEDDKIIIATKKNGFNACRVDEIKQLGGINGCEYLAVTYQLRHDATEDFPEPYVLGASAVFTHKDEKHTYQPADDVPYHLLIGVVGEYTMSGYDMAVIDGRGVQILQLPRREGTADVDYSAYYYYVDNQNRWNRLQIDAEALDKDIESRIPKSYGRVHTSFASAEIDLKTLKTELPLWREDDFKNQPTGGTADVQLDVIDGKLKVKAVSFSPYVNHD